MWAEDWGGHVTEFVYPTRAKAHNAAKTLLGPGAQVVRVSPTLATDYGNRRPPWLPSVWQDLLVFPGVHAVPEPIARRILEDALYRSKGPTWTVTPAQRTAYTCLARQLQSMLRLLPQGDVR